MPFSNVVNTEFDRFFESNILQYREENLEFENEEFANILAEYRDGLLLFDLMENEIWNKASKDSTGLEEYYKANKSKYQWGKRVEVLMASSANKNKLQEALKMMKNGKSEEDIKAKLNTDSEKHIIFTKGVYDLSDSRLPNDFEAKEGLSKIYRHNDAFHVIDVKAVLPEAIKTLEEARGNVINDYQSELETNWIDGLYKRFSVEVNEKVLESVKTKIKNQ